MHFDGDLSKYPDIPNMISLIILLSNFLFSAFASLEDGIKNHQSHKAYHDAARVMKEAEPYLRYQTDTSNKRKILGGSIQTETLKGNAPSWSNGKKESSVEINRDGSKKVKEKISYINHNDSYGASTKVKAKLVHEFDADENLVRVKGGVKTTRQGYNFSERKVENFDEKIKDGTVSQKSKSTSDTYFEIPGAHHGDQNTSIYQKEKTRISIPDIKSEGVAKTESYNSTTVRRQQLERSGGALKFKIRPETVVEQSSIQQVVPPKTTKKD